MPSVQDQLFTAFDVETTGLYPGKDRIVEIGAVSFRGDAVLSRFQSLVDPGIPMPADAGSVNRITDDMLRGQPDISEVLPRFLSFVGESSLVAHNASFDADFVSAEAAGLGLAPIGRRVFDTRSLAMLAFPGSRSYSLSALCRTLGLSAEGAHRALADAEACRQLFLLCLVRFAEGGIADVDGIAALSGESATLSAGVPVNADTTAALHRAIEAAASVEITYVSGSGERTVRRITPLAFRTQGGIPSVEAFCHLRNEKRTFRISAIERIAPCG